jgi:hypothetical protein
MPQVWGFGRDEESPQAGPVVPRPLYQKVSMNSSLYTYYRTHFAWFKKCLHCGKKKRSLKAHACPYCWKCADLVANS